MKSFRACIPLIFVSFLLTAGGAYSNSAPPLEALSTSDHVFFRGNLSLKTKVGLFTQCDTGAIFEIIDRTNGELLQVYEELDHQPEAQVYIEVSGKQDRPSEGIDKLIILKLHHAAGETRGCAEDLKEFSFRANGNEPFWNIVVTTNRILFSEMGKPEIIFPPAIPPVSNNHRYYITEKAGPLPQRLTVDLREKQCRDTMSGAFYSFTAHVRIDNRKLDGCARQGWERMAQQAALQNTSLTADDIKNAEYSSEWSSSGKVKLKDGIYREKIVPDAATELVIRLGDTIAFGDLNNDGVDEGTAILITDSGGSGTFYYLVVLTDNNGTPEHRATAPLGDRIKMQSLTIQSGHILLEMITHGPDDPMASPSLRMRKKYTLQKDHLIEDEND